MLTLTAGTLVLAVANSSATAAQPLTVCVSGCDFTTIPAALAAASSGAVVTVGPGYYNGGFTIAKDVTLRGDGASQTTLSGSAFNGPDAEFAIKINFGTVVTISGARVTSDPTNFDGNTTVIQNLGTLTLKDSTVSGGNATFGGGISNSGTMMLTDTTVTDSFADLGGGVLNGGTLTLKHSMVTSNRAGLQGGGIYNSGTLTLNNSTITGNSISFPDPGFLSGGIYNSGTVKLIHSTITGNTPDDCVGC
jgi:hypothetical protein